MRYRDDHDAAPVHLAEGWVGICASCGWVSEDYVSQGEAADESRRHADTAGSVRPASTVRVNRDDRPSTGVG